MQNKFEEQRSGRNKNTIINKSYIDSGEYRNKFDAISNSSSLNRLLYKLAKKTLIHRSGSMLEDMYWINPITCCIEAKETDNIQEKMIIYSSNTMKTVENYKDNKQGVSLLTLHSHPSSFPPSINDLNSNFENDYGLGVIACHNGKIFLYDSHEKIEPDYYNLVVANNIRSGYNEFDAQIEALQKISKHFEIKVKEV